MTDTVLQPKGTEVKTDINTQLTGDRCTTTTNA